MKSQRTAFLIAAILWPIAVWAHAETGRAEGFLAGLHCHGHRSPPRGGHYRGSGPPMELGTLGFAVFGRHCRSCRRALSLDRISVMKQIAHKTLLLVATLLALPASAHAHLTSTGLGPFYDGVTHFFLSLSKSFPFSHSLFSLDSAANPPAAPLSSFYLRHGSPVDSQVSLAPWQVSSRYSPVSRSLCSVPS